MRPDDALRVVHEYPLSHHASILRRSYHRVTMHSDAKRLLHPHNDFVGNTSISVGTPMG